MKNHNEFLAKSFAQTGERMEQEKAQEIQKAFTSAISSIKMKCGLRIEGTHEILRLHTITTEVVEKLINEIKAKAQETQVATENVLLSPTTGYNAGEEVFYQFMHQEYGFYPNDPAYNPATDELKQQLKDLQKKRNAGDMLGDITSE
jgi:hypothetical protein